MRHWTADGNETAQNRPDVFGEICSKKNLKQQQIRCVRLGVRDRGVLNLKFQKKSVTCWLLFFGVFLFFLFGNLQ